MTDLTDVPLREWHQAPSPGQHVEQRHLAKLEENAMETAMLSTPKHLRKQSILASIPAPEYVDITY